jgi:hypothetical protein
VFFAAGLGIAVAGAVAACSSSAKLAGQGGQCFAATDCEDGLVCVPQPDGRSACTNDVSGIVHMEDAAAMPDAAVRDGTMTDAPPPNDGAQQDTAPQPDSAPPMDSSADSSASDGTTD